MNASERPDAGAVLAQAMQAHGGGRLDDAETLYGELLQAQPDHPDALHLLGVLHAQRGRLDRAAELIEAALAANPREAMFHNNLGNVRIEQAAFDAAEHCYRQALALDANRLDALNNLGVLLGRTGRPDEAEAALAGVLAQAPAFADARQNLASLYLREGRLGDAVQVCCDGLIVAPRNPGLRRALGLAYGMLGRAQEAAEVYRAWLRDDPGNVVAQYHLAACSGAAAAPQRAPDAYVRHLFDGFANSFDAKLASLDYRAPALVAGQVQRLFGTPAPRLQVLDAGCGTGLCGPLLGPWAARLVGVDLSPGMLRKAAATHAYDELVEAELVACLGGWPAAFDLIVSADTLCYFGDLAPPLAAARQAAASGAALVFTVEALPAGAAAARYVLQHHGRYSHTRAYVEGALASAGFERIELQAVQLRTEGGEPVPGWLASARVA